MNKCKKCGKEMLKSMYYLICVDCWYKIPIPQETPKEEQKEEIWEEKLRNLIILIEGSNCNLVISFISSLLSDQKLKLKNDAIETIRKTNELEISDWIKKGGAGMIKDNFISKIKEL